MLHRLAIAAAAALSLFVTAAFAQPDDTFVYIGTHTGGAGQGLYAAKLDEKTGQLTGLGLAAEIERPTWQAVDPRRPVLFSVSETGNDGKSEGAVYSLAIDPATGTLKPISKTRSGGGGATYLDYDSPASTLFVANFGGGQVSAIPVGPDGSLSEPASVVTDYGSGPTHRQTGPHAHAVVVDPSGRFVVVPDLGADRVFVYRFDPATRQLTPALTPFAPLPPGSGPRHLVFSHDGRFAFLDTELTAQVYVFGWTPSTGALTPISSAPIDPPDFQGQRSAAEIVLSRDGRFLYVGSRGANTVNVYAVDRRTGGLSLLQRQPSGGQNPWSFHFDPTGRWLVVANEGSSQLAVLAVDPQSGRLSRTTISLSVPKPVSLAFAP